MLVDGGKAQGGEAVGLAAAFGVAHGPDRPLPYRRGNPVFASLRVVRIRRRVGIGRMGATVRPGGPPAALRFVAGVEFVLSLEWGTFPLVGVGGGTCPAATRDAVFELSPSKD